MPRRPLPPLVLALALAMPVQAQPVPLDSLAAAFAAGAGVPAVVVGVSVGGRHTVVGVGEANGARPDGRTGFEIGSVTKTLTALALADAVVRGEVALDDPIARFLPDTVRTPTADGEPIRLVHLATHTAGLPRLPTNLVPTDFMNPYAAYGDAELWAFLDAVALDAVPGTGYAYSNVGAGLLGRLLARHAGTSYDALLRHRVLGPLGMDETAVVLPDTLVARSAAPHTAAGPIPAWTWTDALAGAGGLRSTADDLLRLVDAVLRPETTPLDNALRLTLAPRREEDRYQIGLIWQMLPAHGGPETVFHNGATFGSRAFVGALPGAGVGVVVLANRSDAPMERFALDLLRRLADAGGD